MLNSLLLFTILFTLIGLIMVSNYIKSPSKLIIIFECLVILNFVLMVYLSSVSNDPRLLVCSIFILFLSSVELVYFILYFSKIS